MFWFPFVRLTVSGLAMGRLSGSGRADRKMRMGRAEIFERLVGRAVPRPIIRKFDGLGRATADHVEM